uniref:HotDog ACOT-type domain-containing protein n=2 Tax=Clastoptera arizonana TaxID=38151 RepID=A0A1B6CSS6_9HEMI
MKASKLLFDSFLCRSMLLNRCTSINKMYTTHIRPESSSDDLHLKAPDQQSTQTVREVKLKFMEVMGNKRGFQSIKQSRAHLLKYLPTSQDELPPKSMQESFDSAIIPLSSNLTLQEKYVNVMGNVRLGRLMEDMDIFAAWIAMNFIQNPKLPEGEAKPYVIVTILVDQISFTDVMPKRDEDIRISGHVSWVGTSSIEVTVWLEQKLLGEWQKLTTAIFLMAARNATNTTGAPVNKIIPANELESKILAAAIARKKRRLIEDKGSVLATMPDPDELRVVHDLFVQSVDLKNPTLNKRILPAGTVWMSDTKQSNIIFSHPEDRNLHNKVFGGFLMRMALELASISAQLHSKHRPKLRHISDISFKKPVNVGSLLRMSSQVVYTEHNYMQIVVYAEVSDPFTGQQATTNMFHFTYESPEFVPPVMPNTYQDAMSYVDGRRHFQEVMGLK